MGTYAGPQVVLSFGIPAALVPLLLMTRRRDVMAELASHPLSCGSVLHRR
ncbi:MAG: hypothetical protein ACJ73S_07805 [Mycobacteriales bacterium]